MTMNNTLGETFLVADIGGTNARFAVAVAGDCELSKFQKFPTSAFSGIIPAANEYLDHISGEIPSRACIAVACPVRGDTISLTNNDWSFSVEEVRQALNLKHLMVINDFKALAAGVPHLTSDERMQIGNGLPIANRPISVIGPGTGLGVANVVQDGGKFIILDGEGGHVGFAPGNEREIEILRQLSRQFGRVSTERILSGAGLATLYQAIARIDGVDAPDLEAADIVEQAKSGSSPQCLETISIFCSALGSFAGDTAMTLSSQGGVFIGGGIVPRIADLLIDSPFRERFEAKGRTSSFIKNVPTYLITTDHTALNGAASLLLDDLRN
ncbi:MAG: glucokinase [Rhodospirillaceae bacterium]|nr:glucokinase [Rhodospirillaceae bacterium]MBL6930028.1 glucokinase [Rhodospirillales bacterium]MBL6940948.1 glucokinase [Rhodospirillales bacterium]